MESFEIQYLYRYNQWANQIILSTANKIDPEKFNAPSICSFGSLRGTLAHIYGAEYVWRMRCEFGVSPPALPNEQDFPDLTTLTTVWDLEMQAMQAYIARLDSVTPLIVKYTNTRGALFETPLWQILIHLVNHGTQFRSEAGMLLSSWGFSPGDMDMIAFFRQS